MPAGQICESTVTWDRMNRHLTRNWVFQTYSFDAQSLLNTIYYEGHEVSAYIPAKGPIVALQHYAFTDVSDLLHFMSTGFNVYTSDPDIAFRLSNLFGKAGSNFNISCSRFGGSGVVIKRQPETCNVEGVSCARNSWRETNTSLLTNTSETLKFHCAGSVSNEFYCLSKQPEPLFRLWGNSYQMQELYRFIRTQRYPCRTQVSFFDYHCPLGHQFKLGTYLSPLCSEGEYEVVEMRAMPWWGCFSMAMGYLSVVEMVTTATVLGLYFTYASGTCFWCNKSKLRELLKVATEAPTQVELHNLRANR